ncbi:MAG: PQQ-binding-like beta-propeller repeat protein [Planctomyces sp.]|nr:PQQ-binding-like beta-propeller repeat protein [Planctomyces sp.]
MCTWAASAGADDDYWNQFRGPRGDGASTSTDLPTTFSEGSPEIDWKTPLPGRAWSSPVIWGRQIWLTNAPEIADGADGETRIDPPIVLSAVCLDLDSGRVVHDLPLFEVDLPQFTHATNSYGSCTPFVEEGRVYIHFGAYGTACLDTATGKKLWERRDLPCDHFRGPGSSPVAYGDLLYLTMDGFDVQYIIALDKRTGETVWKRDRDVDFGTSDGDAKKGYSTPLLIHADGRDQLISPFASATIAYDPLTGEPIWTVRHGGMNAAARPLYGNGLVYLNAADGSDPLLAVPPVGTGDLSDKIAWRSNKSVPKRPSQILVDDLLFLVNDSGVASCVDAMNGETIWTKRLGGEYWSSPIVANGLIYCCSQSGEIPVFKAAREFELVAENKLDDGFVASPAVAGNSLILRSKSHVYRISKSGAAGSDSSPGPRTPNSPPQDD